MSMRLLFAGFTLLAAIGILGCVVILRSRHTVRGLLWILSSLGAMFLGLLLIAGRFFIPDFLSIVVANVSILTSYVLMQQAIAAILGSSRRGVLPGALLLGALCVALSYYTYASNDIGARTVAISVAFMLQISLTIGLLLRHRDARFRYPVRVLRWLFGAYFLHHFSRMILTILWPPPPDLMHPDLLQTFFMFLNFVMVLANYLAIMWLAFWEQHDEVQVVARTDALTGLMNRRAFDEILEAEVSRSRRRSEGMALLLIDLDSFKTINDDYGHQTGDAVLCSVGRVLRVNTRRSDAVARYGGEEFVMLLRGSQRAEAEEIAERLRLEIAGIRGLPQGIRVTASIGVAIKGFGDTAAALMKRSDDALYLSKRSGRNRVSVELVGNR